MIPEIWEHLNQNKARIMELYTIDRKSQMDIALELHVQDINIVEFLKANHITKPPLVKPQSQGAGRPKKESLPADMIRISKAVCSTCEYGEITGVSGCNYYLVTGNRRNCPCDACDKYHKRKGRKKSREFIVKNTIRLPNRNNLIHEERALHGSSHGNGL